MSAVADNAARLLELERQVKANLAALCAKDLTEEQTDALSDSLIPLELEIAAAPCDSRDALLVKLRTVVRTGMIYGQIYAIDDAALIDGIIAYLEGEK